MNDDHSSLFRFFSINFSTMFVNLALGKLELSFFDQLSSSANIHFIFQTNLTSSFAISGNFVSFLKVFKMLVAVLFVCNLALALSANVNPYNQYQQPQPYQQPQVYQQPQQYQQAAPSYNQNYQPPLAAYPQPSYLCCRSNFPGKRT